MLRAAKVCSGVLIWRAVAAADMTAFRASTKVQPPAPSSKTLLTPGSARLYARIYFAIVKRHCSPLAFITIAIDLPSNRTRDTATPKQPSRRRRSRAPFTQRSKRRANVFGEELRLFPGRKVSAHVVLLVKHQFGIRLFRPALRRRIDLVGKRAHASRDLHARNVEEAELVFPVEARRRDPVFVSQYIVMLSSTSSRERPPGLPAKAGAIIS